MSAADQSKPGAGELTENTPSPMRWAISWPFGPMAEITIGTSSGSGAENPSGWIIWMSEPSHSMARPASSSRTAPT
jgi:hypothetical protein